MYPSSSFTARGGARKKGHMCQNKRGSNLQLTVTIIQDSKSDINKNDYNQYIIINQNLLTKVVTSSFLGLCDVSSSESGL
jgi:hypothetical protein